MIRNNLPKRLTLNISHLQNLVMVSDHRKENISRVILERIGEFKNKKVNKKFIAEKKATDKEEIMQIKDKRATTKIKINIWNEDVDDFSYNFYMN